MSIIMAGPVNETNQMEAAKPTNLGKENLQAGKEPNITGNMKLTKVKYW